MSQKLTTRVLLIALAVVGLTCLIPVSALAQSCAMCGTALSAHDPMTRGFKWSILFMMATPYTIFGSVAGWIFYRYHRRPGRRMVTSAQGRASVPAH